MGFAENYRALEQDFQNQVEVDRRIEGLDPHQEIFLPMSFFPPVRQGISRLDAVFVAMYPSQNWLFQTDPHQRVIEANSKIAGGFRNSLSTLWDVVFHLAIREFLCHDGQSYYVTDISKGAMKPKDEEPCRLTRWPRWYRLLQKEMELVLRELGNPATPVIPVSIATASFLKGAGFRHWLETNGLGRVTTPISRKAVTHWAARVPLWWQEAGTFLEEYGEKAYELVDVLLDEANAGPWWIQHVRDNFEIIDRSSSARHCEWLMMRWEEEFVEIRNSVSSHFQR